MFLADAEKHSDKYSDYWFLYTLHNGQKFTKNTSH